MLLPNRTGLVVATPMARCFDHGTTVLVQFSQEEARVRQDAEGLTPGERWTAGPKRARDIAGERGWLKNPWPDLSVALVRSVVAELRDEQARQDEQELQRKAEEEVRITSGGPAVRNAPCATSGVLGGRIQRIFS